MGGGARKGTAGCADVPGWRGAPSVSLGSMLEGRRKEGVELRLHREGGGLYKEKLHFVQTLPPNAELAPELRPGDGSRCFAAGDAGKVTLESRALESQNSSLSGVRHERTESPCVRASVCLFVCLSMSRAARLSSCLPVFPFGCLPVYSPTLSIHLFVCLFTSTAACLFVHVSVCHSTLSVCPPPCLPVCGSFCS